jgi:hypothetical protein
MALSAVRFDELYRSFDDLSRAAVIIVNIEAVVACGMIHELNRQIVGDGSLQKTICTRVQVRIVESGAGQEYRGSAFLAPAHVVQWRKFS